MKHRCPHCQQATISTSQKVGSMWLRPALCSGCRKQSYLPLKQATLAFFVWVILSWLFIGVALAFQHALFLAGTVPAGLLAVDYFVLRQPLRQWIER